MANKNVNTGGGAFIGGSINTGGGNFVGRDSRGGQSEPLIMAGEGFPPGAILSAAFSGQGLDIPSGRYKLMQPVQQSRGMFVYVPV